MPSGGLVATDWIHCTGKTSCDIDLDFIAHSTSIYLLFSCTLLAKFPSWLHLLRPNFALLSRVLLERELCNNQLQHLQCLSTTKTQMHPKLPKPPAPPAGQQQCEHGTTWPLQERVLGVPGSKPKYKGLEGICSMMHTIQEVWQLEEESSSCAAPGTTSRCQ